MPHQIQQKNPVPISDVPDTTRPPTGLDFPAIPPMLRPDGQEKTPMIDGLILLFMLGIYLALIILVIAGFWKACVKAGQPGWAVLIPIYNIYVFLKVAGKPGWWLLLMLIPIVNIVLAIIATVALAERFGKGGGFAVGLIFLPFIFYPILGFGNAQYSPPIAPPPAPA